MAIIRATATIRLEFNTEDGLVSNEVDAHAELLDYLITGPSPGEFDVITEVVTEDDPGPSAT